MNCGKCRKGCAVVQQKKKLLLSFYLTNIHTFCGRQCLEGGEEREMEGAPVSQLVTAPSQSPRNPLSTGPVYCASAEEPGLSLSSFSTLSSKLINGSLLFSLAGIRGS